MSYVRVPPDSTGKFVDTVTVAGQERQVICFGDILGNIASLPATTPSGAAQVGNARSKFKDNFVTFDTTNNWTVTSASTGMTQTVAGSTGGARYLNINTGTTNSDEWSAVSKQSFGLPLKFVVGISASARTPEIYAELVEEDDQNPGTVKTDVAAFTSPLFNNARNGIGVQFTGAQSTTQGAVSVRAQGGSDYTTGAATFGATHLTATGVTPDFIAKNQYEIMLKTDITQVQMRSINSVSSPASTPLTKVDYTPDPDKKYLIRLRVKNPSSGSAATDVRFHFVRIIDCSSLAVDFSVIGGGTADALAAPVKVIGANTLSTNGSTSYPVIAAAAATGIALTPHKLISAATVNSTNVKATAGRIASGLISNSSAAWRYFKLYNKATAPTVGTDTPIFTLGLPPGQTVSLSDIANQYGISFATGIGYGITVNPADSDTTVIGANEVLVNIQYI